MIQPGGRDMRFGRKSYKGGDFMTTAIESALKDLDNVFPAGEDGFYYQGQELAGKECKEVPAFQGLIHYINCMQF